MAIASAFVPLAGGAAHAAGSNIRATLEAETLRPAAGSRIELALNMVPKRGWHGYWRNPGDAGAGVFISWSMPDNMMIGALRYPVPTRLMTGALMNYVYDRPYALLMTLQIPKGLAHGTPVRVAGKARWLACSATLCVPEQGAVAIDLVIGDGAVTAAARSRFAAWRSKLPVPLGRPATFKRLGGRFSLSIPYPRDWPLTDPYFYPGTDRLISHGAPQLISRRDDRLIVELTAAADTTRVPSFEGVMATGDRGYSLTATMRAERKGAD